MDIMSGKDNRELPMGFGAALAQNEEAMQKFSMLTVEEKDEIINGTHVIKSRREMKDYVNRIADMY